MALCGNGGMTIRLVAALGNPGMEYSNTRHNAGFKIADAFIDSLPESSIKKHDSSIAEIKTAKFAGRTLWIMKPKVFMNLSGEAVAPFMAKKEILPEELLLVYDDLDIPLGKIRISKGGGFAGHNGVESVAEKLGNANFARLRAGIGVPHARRNKDFVLSEFAQDEFKIFSSVIEMAVDAIKMLLSRGIDAAMNKYNGMDLEKFEQFKIKQNGG